MFKVEKQEKEKGKEEIFNKWEGKFWVEWK